MKLLVTGGCGFIGSNVIRHVVDRPEVELLVNVDCLTYAGDLRNVADVSGHPKYRFEQLDLRDKAAMVDLVPRHGITHVLHLAAESHVDRSIASPDAFIHTNVLGTFHLLEACRHAWAGNLNGRKFHHVSTDEVFGSLEGVGAFQETSPACPSSPYSASKAGADMLVRAFHRTYALPAVITNCGNNFGPCQHPEKLIPVILGCLLGRRKIPIYGDGLQVRDWIYVRDHAEALWQVLTRGRPGETYNIGARCERTNRELASRLCDIFDELAPEFGGDSRTLIARVADRPGHDRRYAVDPAKLESELGWRPVHEFDQALRETVSWYLENRGRLG